MKKILWVLVLLILHNFSYAQSKSEEYQRAQNKQSSVTKTLVINTNGYPAKTFREFQKELKGWSGKVLSYNNDTILKTFTLTHNGLLHPREFEAFLYKYKIKGNTIISYQ